jgi:hypothetical protein
MMLLLRIEEGQQIPLIHEVHSDDAHLLNTIDGEWFDILYQFPWQAYRQVAADYYNALYDFNQVPPKSAAEDDPINPESKDEARQRLLFDRATAPAQTNQPARPHPVSRRSGCRAGTGRTSRGGGSRGGPVALGGA